MSLMFTLLISLASFAAADLRMASWPKGGYALRDQGTTPWNVPPGAATARYMEPSTFSYDGLENQKNKNYDNFLRSNIDNEQDNRDFDKEPGKDHLPFRTLETEVAAFYHRPAEGARRRRPEGVNQIPHNLVQSVKPGESLLVPLRWNNPHSSEQEVNLWIFEHAGTQPIVVPLSKPVCSGEGYLNNIVSITVPEDFSKLGKKIPGFKGCNEDSKPMCTVQIYSHSVESRTYAIGFPIVIPGHKEELTTNETTAIQPVSKDPWLQISDLRDTCLPATDSTAAHSTAVPKWARLVSDVYNHAYQNSDYSPYSGQQHEFISKNLQASAINKMEVGNRGELGDAILPEATKARLNQLRKLETKIYKNYEKVANNIIIALGDQINSTGKLGIQQLANCFRCAETGSTGTKRFQTNTYIPSFQLPKDLQETARSMVPKRYAELITESGLVQIYVASMSDLLPFFYQSRSLGIMYQEAVVKSTMSTMDDSTNFLKVNADGEKDEGVYASSGAKQKFVEAHGCPSQCLFPTGDVSLHSGNYTEYANKNANPQNINERPYIVFSAQGCQDRCTEEADCACVTYKFPTCNRHSICNLADFRSARDHTVYVAAPSADFAKPLVKGSTATKISGECQQCAQFFGEGVNPLTKPQTTQLAASVASNGLPSDMGKLADNPEEGNIYQPGNSPEINVMQKGNKRKMKTNKKNNNK